MSDTSDRLYFIFVCIPLDHDSLSLPALRQCQTMTLSIITNPVSAYDNDFDCHYQPCVTTCDNDSICHYQPCVNIWQCVSLPALCQWRWLCLAGYPHSKLMNRTLYMQVLDYDRFSRDDPIGEICLPLNDLDLTTGQTMWRALQPCKGHMVCIIADLCLYSGKTYTFITQVFHKYGNKTQHGLCNTSICLFSI